MLIRKNIGYASLIKDASLSRQPRWSVQIYIETNVSISDCQTATTDHGEGVSLIRKGFVKW